MNPSGVIAIGIGLLVVAVIRGIRSVRADVDEMKLSIAQVMREVESHEWHVQHFEPPGRWRDDMLYLLADAKQSLAAANMQTPKVLVSQKARRHVLRLERHAVEQLRAYRAHKKSAETWNEYLSEKHIHDMPHA